MSNRLTYGYLSAAFFATVGIVAPVCSAMTNGIVLSVRGAAYARKHIVCPSVCFPARR
ncbi:MAG: hypothetical protein GX418_11390 [Clostridiales bacterium]|nr:hypothetical protein [Clostridiales bacterium]